MRNASSVRVPPPPPPPPTPSEPLLRDPPPIPLTPHPLTFLDGLAGNTWHGLLLEVTYSQHVPGADPRPLGYRATRNPRPFPLERLSPITDAHLLRPEASPAPAAASVGARRGSAPSSVASRASPAPSSARGAPTASTAATTPSASPVARPTAAPAVAPRGPRNRAAAPPPRPSPPKKGRGKGKAPAPRPVPCMGPPGGFAVAPPAPAPAPLVCGPYAGPPLLVPADADAYACRWLGSASCPPPPVAPAPALTPDAAALALLARPRHHGGGGGPETPLSPTSPPFHPTGGPPKVRATGDGDRPRFAAEPEGWMLRAAGGGRRGVGHDDDDEKGGGGKPGTGVGTGKRAVVEPGAPVIANGSDEDEDEGPPTAVNSAAGSPRAGARGAGAGGGEAEKGGNKITESGRFAISVFLSLPWKGRCV